MFDAAFLATRYRDEFGTAQIPAAVQRIVFPVVVLAGRLLGRYDRYADGAGAGPALTRYAVGAARRWSASRANTAPSVSRKGSFSSSHVGSHQVRSPASFMIDGSRPRRTIVAR